MPHLYHQLIGENTFLLVTWQRKRSMQILILFKKTQIKCNFKSWPRWWVDWCMLIQWNSSPIVVYLFLIVTLEQLPLACASSVKVILSLINSGMNQVAGTARRMTTKELLPQRSSSKNGPKLSISLPTLPNTSF